jgi:hypothetical protein
VTRVEYRAVDADGNVGAVRARAVRVDTRSPGLEARAASAGADGRARLRFRVVDQAPSCGSALVRVVIVDAGGRALTRASTRPAKVGAWHTIRVRTAGLAPGKYTAVLRALDAAGTYPRGVTRVTLTVR